MPIEPPRAPWLVPDLDGLPDGQEFVAVGADLSPGMLLAGYRGGIFAMPEADVLGWWSPDPRGILRPGEVHVARSLNRALARFTVSVDAAFDDVVTACADPARPHGWITGEYRASYRALHELGWAHSVEVWDVDGTLAGGLFGVEVGGLVAAESKFHRRTDASKVAVVALASLLAAPGDAERFVDVQWRTPHLASLGVDEVARATYRRMLARALRLPPVLGGAAQALVAPGSAGVRGASTRIRWRST